MQITKFQRLKLLPLTSKQKQTLQKVEVNRNINNKKVLESLK